MAEEQVEKRNAQTKGKKKKGKSKERKMDDKISGKQFMADVGGYIKDRRLEQVSAVTSEIIKASKPYIQ